MQERLIAQMKSAKPLISCRKTSWIKRHIWACLYKGVPSHVLCCCCYMIPLVCFSLEVPAVVVGVVGMGHVPGIERNWDKELNIHEIMRFVFAVSAVMYCSAIVQNLSWQISLFLYSLSVAPPSRFGWVLRNVFKGAVWGLLGYACFRASKGMGRALLSLPAVQSLLENVRTPAVWPLF